MSLQDPLPPEPPGLDIFTRHRPAVGIAGPELVICGGNVLVMAYPFLVVHTSPS